MSKESKLRKAAADDLRNSRKSSLTVRKARHLRRAAGLKALAAEEELALVVSLCGREVAIGAYLGDAEMERSASNQIRVRSDDGMEHTVLELTRVSPTLKGARRWILEDGRPVECINDETFQIVQTGEILKKV